MNRTDLALVLAPRATLEQWRALVAVIEAGGYAAAAQRLHKSQSTLTHALKTLQSRLGVQIFKRSGRKAVLTPTGEVLYRRAQSLLDEARALETAAQRLGAGCESELRLAVEIVFPTWLLLRALARFGQEYAHTHIELYETVLGGTTEMLTQRQADLAICSSIPPGFLGDPLMRLRFVPVAHPQHPLHRLGRKLTLQDLRKHRHLVIRDTGSRRDNRTWLSAAQRWTVSHKATSIQAVCEGLGFAWFPEEAIRGELERGVLKVLPLREGAERYAELYLVFADPDYAGPGARRLAELIRQEVGQEGSRHAAAATPSPARHRRGLKQTRSRGA
ncbi:MAG: LysR family transcriptional regulator [Sinobacteraceae bacterium]|nr:LysR family transcriptional regulator [Nevskiaceae bacterium]